MVVFARVLRHAAVDAPLHADAAGEVARRRDDARFDFDLRLRTVERSRSAEPLPEAGLPDRE